MPNRYLFLDAFRILLLMMADPAVGGTRFGGSPPCGLWQQLPSASACAPAPTDQETVVKKTIDGRQENDRLEE